jgi:hypothetical protein
LANKFVITKNDKIDHAVDIHFQDQVLCLIEWSKEANELKIVFCPYKTMKKHPVFLIEDFLNALKEAKNIVLQSMNKNLSKS